MPTAAELEEQARERAHAMLTEHESLIGHRIRVTRVVVYEGEASAVFEQLARSLPVGTRDMQVAGSTHGKKMSMTVLQDTPVRLVSETDLRDLLAWQRALAKLPPAITVAALGLCSPGGAPSIRLVIGDVVVRAGLASQLAPTGDVQYIVRVGERGPAAHASVTSTDPRGIIGGMVEEIGQAAAVLAAFALAENSNGP